MGALGGFDPADTAEVVQAQPGFAVCRRVDGRISSQNGAMGVLRSVDASAVAATMPSALWRALLAAPLGEPFEWWPPNAPCGLRATRLLFDGEHDLVTLVPVERREDTQARRLYEAARHVMARMIAGAAHDLRSPLSSMTFNLGVLRRRFSQLPDAERTQLLDAITASCEWQLQAVDALVDAAARPDTTDVPLQPLLERIAERLRPLFRVRNGRVIIDVPAELTVRGAVMSIDHVFLNLLSNAAQSGEGSITARVSWVSDGVDGCARLRVQDDGPGIPEGLRPHLFQPFASPKHDAPSMGLCLAREAARELGGDILLVDSDVGACFEVRLPLCDEGQETS